MLNADQQRVVDTRTGATCVIAGPGSGKTETMKEHYLHLLYDGVLPSKIMCLTFTKEAAEGMAKRAKADTDTFRTFHSFGYYLVTKETGKQPVEPELRYRLLSKLKTKYHLDYKELESFISKLRHAGISPNQATEETGEWKYGYPKAYAEYEMERRTGGWIDFDSMLVDAVQLLENPQVRQRWQYEHVLVDESQDTDNLQWRLMQQISEKSGNILVFGDPNQSIYAWRDAHPENLVEFQKWFPSGTHQYLGINYRSTRNIVDFVKRHTPVNTPLTEKMTAAREIDGEPIGFKTFRTETEEAEDTISRANADPLNSTILARTNRMLAGLETICIEHRIKYTLLGRSGFWKRTEIRKAIDRLRTLPKTFTIPVAFFTVMNEMESRYRVSDATEADNDALDNLRTLSDIAKRFKTLPELVHFADKVAHAKRRAQGITLSTVHQAKGCEWKNVYLIGCRADMMPHKKGDWQEEARIFYVAISRPIDYLRISWAGTASPFLRGELPDMEMAKIQADATQYEKILKQLNLLEPPK